jgi:hypothetical protein
VEVSCSLRGCSGDGDATWITQVMTTKLDSPAGGQGRRGEERSSPAQPSQAKPNLQGEGDQWVGCNIVA